MTHISVINRFIRYGTNAFCLLFRLTALLALGMLLVFPAWKGIWAGYVAIVAGGVLLAFIIRGAPRLAPSITHLNEVFFVAFLVLFTTMMQFLLIVAFQSQPSLDGYFVYREAVALLETGRMNPLTYYPPAQIWYFALCFKVFGASPLMAQLCQIPLTMLVPVLVYLIGRRSCSVTTARWAAI